MKQRTLLWWNKVFIPGVTQALFFISFNFLLENIKICIMKIDIESTSLLRKTHYTPLCWPGLFSVSGILSGKCLSRFYSTVLSVE